MWVSFLLMLLHQYMTSMVCTVHTKLMQTCAMLSYINLSTSVHLFLCRGGVFPCTETDRKLKPYNVCACITFVCVYEGEKREKSEREREKEGGGGEGGEERGRRGKEGDSVCVSE